MCLLTVHGYVITAGWERGQISAAALSRLQLERLFTRTCVRKKSNKVVCVLCFFGIFKFETIAFVIDLNEHLS